MWSSNPPLATAPSYASGMQSPVRAVAVPVAELGLGPRRSFGVSMVPDQGYVDPASPRNNNVAYGLLAGGETDLQPNSLSGTVQARIGQLTGSQTMGVRPPSVTSSLRPMPPPGPPPTRPPPPPGPPPPRQVLSPAVSGEELLEAARRGDGEEVAELLERGADVVRAPVDPETRATLLHYAAGSGALGELLRRCIQQAPAMVNAADAGGETPLMRAAYGGRAEAVRALLAARANPEAREAGGESALHAAARVDAAEAAHELLKAGAAVNAVSNHRRSPLHLAAAAGSLGTMQTLLSSGADPTLADAEGTTALMLAAGSGDVRCVELLLAAYPNNVNDRDARHRSALVHALDRRELPAARALLDRGANPAVAGPEASTPAPLAVAASHLDMAACSLLLQRGAPAGNVRRAREAREARTGRTVLMAVAQAGDPELEPLAAELLEAGADPNARDAAGRTALMYAARNGRRRLAGLLAARGADVNAQDGRGMSGLMWAAYYPEADGVVELLVDEARADTALQDPEGWTALHFACYAGRADAARALRAGAADPQAKDRRHLSALQWAAWRGHWEVVEALADAADPADAALLALAPRATHPADGASHLERMAAYFVDGEARPGAPFGARTPFGALAAGSERGVLAALVLAKAFRARAEACAAREGAGRGDAGKLERAAEECLALSHGLLDAAAERADPDLVEAAVADQLGVDARGLPTVSPSPIDLASELGAARLLAHGAAVRLVDRLWSRGCTTSAATLGSLLVRPFGVPLNLCDGSTGSFFAAPRGKFCLEVVFYLAFVAVYTHVVMHPTTGLQFRELLLFLLYLAFLQYEVGQLLEERLAYFRSPWNALDCLLAALFAAAFVARLRAVATHDEAHAMVAFDILAAIGVLLYLRLVRVFELHSRLGPLVQIVGGMLADVATFAVLFAALMAGFVVTIHGIAGTVVGEEPSPLSGTVGVVLRATLGDVDFHAFDEAAPVAGQALLALWTLLSVVLLLNLLIAIFTGTYEAVASRSEEAYRLSFAKTVLAFNRDGLFVPPPLNLLRVLIDVPFLCWRLSDRRGQYPRSTPGLAICTLFVLVLLAPFSVLYFALRPGPALSAFAAVKAARVRREDGRASLPGRRGFSKLEEDGEEEGEPALPDLDAALVGPGAPFFAEELPSAPRLKEESLGAVLERVEGLQAVVRAAVHEAVKGALAPPPAPPAPAPAPRHIGLF